MGGGEGKKEDKKRVERKDEKDAQDVGFRLRQTRPADNRC